MTTIESVTLEVAGLAAAKDFYAAAFGTGPQLRLRASDTPTTGFRGFMLSLVVAQPGTVDNLLGTALDAGAKQLKAPKKQFWGGYEGILQVPDGTIWKVATEAKKNTGPATRDIDGIALVLGVADLGRIKRFYVDRGLTVAKSFGSRYVDFDAAEGAVKLALYKRGGLAKHTRVPPEGTGSHRIAIGSDAAPFTDPDGFVWEASAVPGDSAAASSSVRG
jgi:hypothetical protein